MSEARIERDISQADWSKRIKILTLRQSGMSFGVIATQLGITRQGAQQMYKKIRKMTIAEAGAIASNLK